MSFTGSPSIEESRYRWHTNCYGHALNNWTVCNIPGEIALVKNGFDHQQLRHSREEKRVFPSDLEEMNKVEYAFFIQSMITRWKEGAYNDGLLPAETFDIKCGKKEFHLAAMAVQSHYHEKRENDFHWFRRNLNGLWSHKMSGYTATCLDENKKEITNPEQANRGYYEHFVDYFWVPQKLKTINMISLTT